MSGIDTCLQEKPYMSDVNKNIAAVLTDVVTDQGMNLLISAVLEITKRIKNSHDWLKLFKDAGIEVASVESESFPQLSNVLSKTNINI